MDSLSELERQVLELRIEDGYTINETVEELKITSTIFKKIVKKLEELGLYDEELLKKAKRRRKSRERYEKTKGKKVLGLSEEEEKFRQLCISFMCEKYFNYNITKQMNPILVTKLKKLNSYASYEVIYRTMQTQEAKLNYIHSNKNFNSENQEMSYLLAVVKNNLIEINKKLNINNAINDAKLKATNMNEDIIEMLSQNIETKPTTKRDLSEFID